MFKKYGIKITSNEHFKFLGILQNEVIQLLGSSCILNSRRIKNASERKGFFTVHTQSFLFSRQILVRKSCGSNSEFHLFHLAQIEIKGKAIPNSDQYCHTCFSIDSRTIKEKNLVIEQIMMKLSLNFCCNKLFQISVLIYQIQNGVQVQGLLIAEPQIRSPVRCQSFP